MIDFFRLLLAMTSTFLIWMVISSGVTSHRTQEKINTAFTSNAILIGDSHAQNLPWPESQSAFILPGSGLLHTYLVVKQLTTKADSTAPKPILVATIWPGSFGRDQESRFTGEFRDSWGAAIGGRTCNYWSASDWLNARIPLYTKSKALLGKLQVNQTNTHQDGNTCNSDRLKDSSLLVVDSSFYSPTWLEDATFSWWLFNEINLLVSEANMTLIWVSTPTHPNFLESVPGIEFYRQRMSCGSEHIHHMDALEFRNTASGFLDYHHINCNIAYPLSDSLENYLLNLKRVQHQHAIQQP